MNPAKFAGGYGMKACKDCNRVNPDDAKTCLECDGKEFEEIIFLLEEEE